MKFMSLIKQTLQFTLREYTNFSNKGTNAKRKILKYEKQISTQFSFFFIIEKYSLLILAYI